MVRRLVLSSLAALGALALSCSEEAAPAPVAPDEGAGGRDAAHAGEVPGEDAGVDVGTRSTCAITRAYFDACGQTDITCGVAFVEWCEQNDAVVNSEAFRRAEAFCLTEDHCDGKERRACEYARYGDEAPTSAQRSLVTAYCAMCEPADVAGCSARSTSYDPALGIDGVGDIFVAAWELADPIVAEIESTCTSADADGGGGTDAGPDACAKAFGSCAAEIYLARVPDCPAIETP